MTKTIDSFMACIGTGCILTIINFLVGKIDYSLIFLFICMFTDFLTGLMCGAFNKQISSDVCIKGLMKKFMILVYVMLAHHLDVLLNVHYIRIGVCYMYATGEVISIIENGVLLGLPVPTPIKKGLDVLRGGDDDEHDIGNS